MNKIYNAINQEDAMTAIDQLNNKWADKYPYSVKSWLINQAELTTFLNFPVEIRKIMYTTNIIENLNRQIRKNTSSKTMFPTDQAVLKAVYLSIQSANITSRQTIKNWPTIANQFNILFGDKIKLDLRILPLSR